MKRTVESNGQQWNVYSPATFEEMHAWTTEAQVWVHPPTHTIVWMDVSATRHLWGHESLEWQELPDVLPPKEAGFGFNPPQLGASWRKLEASQWLDSRQIWREWNDPTRGSRIDLGLYGSHGTGAAADFRQISFQEALRLWLENNMKAVVF